MNKKIQILLSTILVIVLFGTQISYAITTNEKEKFFEVSSAEVAKKETLEMTFNLDKIEYDKFKIVLNSNIDNGEIYTDENVAIEEEKDAIVIEFDKTKMNLSQLKLCYVVPENTEINSKIQLTAKIIVEEEIESEDEEGNTTTKKQEKTVLEESKNVIVLEKEENIEKDNSQNGNEEKEDKQKDSTQNDTNSKDSNAIDRTNEEQKSQNNEMSKVANNTDGTMSQKNSQTPTDTKSGNKNMSSNVASNGSGKNSSNVANNKSSVSGSNNASNMQGSSQSGKNVETATYNGSNNNYLKKLKVKGVDLNTTFNKENTTYFIHVKDISSLKITATADDSSAKVMVTGNDDIKEGTNKILIAVTAENGDVRYYRIFVIVN